MWERSSKTNQFFQIRDPISLTQKKRKQAEVFILPNAIHLAHFPSGCSCREKENIRTFLTSAGHQSCAVKASPDAKLTRVKPPKSIPWKVWKEFFPLPPPWCHFDRHTPAPASQSITSLLVSPDLHRSSLVGSRAVSGPCIMHEGFHPWWINPAVLW